jgi:hypothetical protein
MAADVHGLTKIKDLKVVVVEVDHLKLKTN